MSNDELIAQLTAERDAWWNAHDALSDLMTWYYNYPHPDRSLKDARTCVEDDYERAITRARSLMKRIPSPTGATE